MAVQLQSAFNAALGSVKHVLCPVVGCCALTNLTMQRMSQVHQPQHRPAALWRVAALTVLTLRLASLAWHWATDRMATPHAQPAAPLSSSGVMSSSTASTATRQATQVPFVLPSKTRHDQLHTVCLHCCISCNKNLW